jgi:hypothetical protein
MAKLAAQNSQFARAAGFSEDTRSCGSSRWFAPDRRRIDNVTGVVREGQPKRVAVHFHRCKARARQREQRAVDLTGGAHLRSGSRADIIDRADTDVLKVMLVPVDIRLHAVLLQQWLHLRDQLARVAVRTPSRVNRMVPEYELPGGGRAPQFGVEPRDLSHRGLRCDICGDRLLCARSPGAIRDPRDR